MYGPIVLAARLGTQGITPGSQLIVNERKSGEMLNEAIEIPAWSKPLEELPASLQRTSEHSVTFTSSGFRGRTPRRIHSLVPRRARALQPLLAPLR